MKGLDKAIVVLMTLILAMILFMLELRIAHAVLHHKPAVVLHVARAPPPPTTSPSPASEENSGRAPPPMPSAEEDGWLVAVRIQKTGTKSFLAELNHVLDAAGWRRCTGLPWCCTRVEGYGPGNGVKACSSVLPAFYAHAQCRTSTTVHSDYTDLTLPLEASAAPFVAVTMIRDPVRRVISEYKHLSGGTNKPKKNWDYVPADREPKNRENFLAFLADDANAPGMRNRQTRMLGGWHADEREMLRRAKEHLDRMPFFGVTDMYDESIGLLWRTFGLEHPKEHVHARMDAYDGRQMFDIDEEVAAAVLHYNALDEELFRYGKALFLERLAQ